MILPEPRATIQARSLDHRQRAEDVDLEVLATLAIGISAAGPLPSRLRC